MTDALKFKKDTSSSRDYSYKLTPKKEEISFLKDGRYSPYSTSYKITNSPSYTNSYGFTDLKLASSPPKKRAPTLESYVGSASQTANKYLRSSVRPNTYNLSSSKYNYQARSSKPRYDVGNRYDSSYTKHLYTYLNDNYDKPYSPLKLNRHNNPYKKESMFRELRTADTIKGIHSIRKELTEKKHLRSPKKYSLSHTLGKTNHNIVNPEYIKPEYLIDHQNLEKADFKIDDLEKEKQINKDLLKVGNGYLEMCKGMLDSIKAVKIGNIAMAENAFNNNRVVMGEADAKKGKEFLEKDVGVKLEDIELVGEDGEEEEEVKAERESAKKKLLNHVSTGINVKAITQSVLDAVFADD